MCLQTDVLRRQLRLAIVLLLVVSNANTKADELTAQARALLKQANTAEEQQTQVLVKRALKQLQAAKASAETKKLLGVCQTYLKAVDLFWQADRHKGSSAAEKQLRTFDKQNPLYLQALLYQGRHHYWKAVEGNYQQGHAISKRMFQEILRANPQHRLARLYLKLPVKPLKASLPAPHSGAPEWAVAAREAMYWTRHMAHWWIDHRQSPDGQLGGGWSDDVEFSKTWSFYCLSLDDDKVRRSLTKIADNIWHCPAVANGYFAGSPHPWHLVDVEHGAEWMSFSQPQMMLARYGDPRYIERNMQVIRNMELLTGINSAGRRLFKSYYFSHDLLHPRQLHHCDVPENGRYTKPGIYIMWYSQHPKVMKWCREWGDSWVHHSLGTALGKPSGFFPSEIVYATDKVGGMSGKWYRIAGYPGYGFAAGSWSTKHLMGQLIANAKIFGKPRYVEPLRRIVKWKRDHKDAPYGKEGTTGWILRKEYTAERMWAKWKRIRDGWKSDQAEQLVKELRKISSLHASTWEMNTREVIATDRVSIQARPSQTLMNMYTGGSGAMQAYYPDSAVAWSNVELQAVPWVREADHEHLKIQIHSFDKQPRTVTLRPLELDTGNYEVRINGQRQRDFQLAHRFEPLQLTLKPQTTTRIEIRQIAARQLPKSLPDLALSETECLLDRSTTPATLSVRVHNVGIRNSGPTTVTFTAISKTGERRIAVQNIKDVAWPKMLMPSYVVVKQPWKIDRRVHSIRVELSKASTDEICLENNRVEVAMKDWRKPSAFRERHNLFGPAGSKIPRPSLPIAQVASPPGKNLPYITGFDGDSSVFGPFRETGNLRFPVRYDKRQPLAWMVRDKHNLYVLVTSWKSGDKLRRLSKPGKAGPIGNFAADDRIELLFQPPGKPWRSIQVNANGAVLGKIANSQTWRPIVKSVQQVRAEEWCPEWWCRLEIPLESIWSKTNPVGQTWRWDIVRHGFNKGQPQRTSWSGGIANQPKTWGRVRW